ncbi:hypothetical protein GQX74_010535 [Glossina fuscipes]|nr:hypothetical protein GQX74_010535 [Glossina fuscipes]
MKRCGIAINYGKQQQQQQQQQQHDTTTTTTTTTSTVTSFTMFYLFRMQDDFNCYTIVDMFCYCAVFPLLH